MQTGQNLPLSVIGGLSLLLLLNGCVSLDKEAEARVPFQTCMMVFGDCVFQPEDVEKTYKRAITEGDVEINEPPAYPPIGSHGLP